MRFDLIERMINWLVDRSIDWLIDWFLSAHLHTSRAVAPTQSQAIESVGIGRTEYTIQNITFSLTLFFLYLKYYCWKRNISSKRLKI